MIEGGGLGVFEPDDVGPMSVQVPNGVVDIAVADEAEAVAVAKQYLSYFQGPVDDVGRAPTSARCATSIPENRLRVYDVRARDRRPGRHRLGARAAPRRSASGMVTALARDRGPAGRRRSPTTRRTSAARSTPTAPTRRRGSCSCATRSTCRSCSCATRPGFMVGPEAEKTALVRHVSRHVRHRRQPDGAVLHDRPAQGLRARRAGDGRRHFKAPLFCVAWPTGEFGGMGLEGAVRLGYRNELEADRRRGRAASALFDEMVARMYEHGKARQHRQPTSRSTTSSTRPTPGAGSPRPSARAPAAARPHGQEAPQHRHLVTGRVPTPSLVGNRRRAVPSVWRDLVARRLGAWDRLDRGAAEPPRSAHRTPRRREAVGSSAGLTLTDEMRVTIAAHAALLVLEIGYAADDDISSIIVHASTIFLTGEQPGPIPGSRSDETVELIGEAHHKGPVLLSWDAASTRLDTRKAATTSSSTSSPIVSTCSTGWSMARRSSRTCAARQRWIDVCTAEFHALRSGAPDDLLSDYAAKSPGEFFAVATEVFFTRSDVLRTHKPDLYLVLSDFYRQDPAGGS